MPTVQVIESLLDGDKYRMAISADEHCDDLLDTLMNPKSSLPTGKPTSDGGSMLDGGTTVLLLYRNFPQPSTDRQKRDTEEQCRQVTLTVNLINGRHSNYFLRRHKLSCRALISGQEKTIIIVQNTSGILQSVF